MGIFFFTAVSNGEQIACGSKYRHAIRRVSIIQTSLFYFSLLISYSLNGDLYQNGTNLIFFARKFRQQLEARAKLLLSLLDMALFTALHTCDVSPLMTWIRPFSKWQPIKRQKIFVKFGFAQYIVYWLVFNGSDWCISILAVSLRVWPCVCSNNAWVFQSLRYTPCRIHRESCKLRHLV